MSENTRSSWSRVVAHRIPIVASLAIGSLALVVSAATGSPVGGPLAFGRPADQAASASNSIMYADPNPISVCNGATADTTLRWNIARTKQYKIYRNAAVTPFTQGFGSGTYVVHGVSVGNTFRIDTYISRVQSSRGGRQPIWIKDASNTVTISLNPATDCAPVPPAPPTEEPRLSCNPNPQSARVGQSVTFTALGGVGNYTWTASGATPATASGSNYTFTYASAGNKTVTVASGAQTATCQLTITIVNLPPPPPVALSCSPATQSVQVGETATVTTNAAGVVDYAFTWSAIGATSVQKNGKSLLVSYGTAGTKTVTVNDYTTTADCTITVTASPTPPAPSQARVGQLVSKAGTVYLVGNSGLIGIPSLAVFNSWCFTFSDLVEANVAESALNQVGVLETRAAGQALPAGVSVLRVTTCPTTTPPPPPIENRLPIAMVDVASCDQNLIKGWAADPDVINSPIKVRITDGGTTLYAEMDTNTVREDANTYLATQYNAGQPVSGAHGFSFDLNPIRADEQIHLFAMELVDNTGAKVRVNMGNMGSFVCPAIVNPHASLSMSYKQITLIDKHDNSIVITDPTGRDDTTVTYKEDTITVGDTMDICPGPDGTIGRRKNVALTGWISPNGGSVFVKDSVTNQEKWFATHVGPTTQTNLWTALLGPGNTAITYTFRVSNYYSGANTVLTKTVTVRPITGPCDPGEYTLTYFLDNTPYCPRNNQYTRVYATATLENVNSQPPLASTDSIVVKFRPFGKQDVPENWQVLPVEVKRSYTNDPHYFVISTLAFTMQEKGTYDFFLKFRGKTIHQVSKEYFVGLPGPFCE